MDVTPRFKEPSDRHPRGCNCRPCIGRRNRREGLRKQREARKRLGVPANKFGDSNEERWADQLWSTEVKSGSGLRPVLTAWLKAEAQIAANQADHGDRHRPPRVVLMPAGWGSEGLVVVRLASWEAVVRPALDDHSGIEAAKRRHPSGGGK
jgi:hypothetical protein